MVERGREGYNICIYIYRERKNKKERKGRLKRIEKLGDYSTITS